MRKEWWNSFGEPWPFASMMGFGRGRFFESGEMRLAILSLLGEGPKHGYQLMKEMEERSGGFYRASAGSIYPALQQLEDEDLIRADQGQGKRVYNITEAGRAELAKDPEAVRRIWRRAEQWEEWRHGASPETIGFVLHSATPLMKTIFKAAGRAGRLPGGTDRIKEILDRARHELEAL